MNTVMAYIRDHRAIIPFHIILTLENKIRYSIIAVIVQDNIYVMQLRWSWPKQQCHAKLTASDLTYSPKGK